jgi:hypothetical protein
MRRRLSALLPALLLVLLAAAAPAAAGAPERRPLDLSRALSFSWDQVFPDLAALFHPRLQSVSADAIQPYCFTTEDKCTDSQKQAAGTKSGCYKSGKLWCYDLFLPGEPGGRLPPIQGG